MAKRGRRVTFHGAFKSKARARAKEAKVRRAGHKGVYVERIRVRGQVRYAVITRHKGS
jgi:hypothetical protein